MLLAEIKAARGVVLDGPQGLAERGGKRMRECERRLGAAGKTPEDPPSQGPFSGFVRSSVELFAAFHRAGVAISPNDLTGAVAECYPGGNWRKLVNSCILPRKTTTAGRAVRRAILESLGVKFPDITLSHDQLDACLGATIAAAADNALHGVNVERVGKNLIAEDSVLREGPILLLKLDEALTARIKKVIAGRGGSEAFVGNHIQRCRSHA